MPATLCLHPPDQPSMLRVLTGEIPEVSIGRSEEANIPVLHTSVSRRHAALRFDGAHWWLHDLGSTNGVRMSGAPVSAPQQLRHGDWFSLGDVYCEFRTILEADLAAINKRSALLRQASVGWLDRISVAPGRDELLAGLLAAFVELAECQRGFLLAGDMGAGFSTAACYTAARDTSLQQQFSGSTSTVARAIHTRLPVIVGDPNNLEWARARRSIIDQELLALIAVPILYHGRLLGVAYADSNTPGKRFSELDRDLLLAFVQDAATLLAARGFEQALSQIASCIETDANGQIRKSGPTERWWQSP
jgi:FHA domain/GAF domain